MNSENQTLPHDLGIVRSVKAKLKWFNAAKGFGFVVPENSAVDAFLHITQLQKLGVHGIGEGATVLCDIDFREKGATVSRLIEVIDPGHVPVGCIVKDPANTEHFDIRGIVKLFRSDKGFGFVSPNDGMKDIFVHNTCLVQCGIKELSAGQAVKVTFKTTPKGREAVKIECIETI